MKPFLYLPVCSGAAYQMLLSQQKFCNSHFYISWIIVCLNHPVCDLLLSYCLPFLVLAAIVGRYAIMQRKFRFMCWVILNWGYRKVTILPWSSEFPRTVERLDDLGNCPLIFCVTRFVLQVILCSNQGVKDSLSLYKLFKVFNSLLKRCLVSIACWISQYTFGSAQVYYWY